MESVCRLREAREDAPDKIIEAAYGGDIQPLLRTVCTKDGGTDRHGDRSGQVRRDLANFETRVHRRYSRLPSMNFDMGGMYEVEQSPMTSPR